VKVKYTITGTAEVDKEDYKEYYKDFDDANTPFTDEVLKEKLQEEIDDYPGYVFDMMAYSEDLKITFEEVK